MSTPREETVGTYEMMWDCSSCGQQGNLGKTHRYCPNCGAPQDETKRYFPTEAQRVAVKDHKFSGADRKCPNCGTPSSAAATNCGNCGAPLDGAKTVPLVGATPVLQKKRSNAWVWWLLVGLLVFSVLIWYRCIRKREIALQVTGHRWSTAVEIEEYKDVEDHAWRDQVPGEARFVSCREKERSQRSVPDGETCTTVKRDKGDGTFDDVKQCTPKTRQEPVYDDWCDFRINRWTKVEELPTHGTGLTLSWANPPPPAVTIGLGARRVGKKTATYTLDMSDGKNTRTCDVSESTWRKYTDGQSIKAQVRASSGSIVCGSL